MGSATTVETVRAKVTSSLSFNGGFTILRCLMGSQDFTATGAIPMEGSLDGLVLTLTGTWGVHPRYGRQFNFTSCSVEGGELLFFLAKAVRGVGLSLARKLVQQFGEEELLRILDHEPQRLLSLRGIKEKRLQLIMESWQTFKPLHDLIRYLAPYQVTTNLLLRVYNSFEAQSVAILKENPYRLTEIHGIGFQKADELALKIGIPRHAPFRIDCCIEYLFQKWAFEQGNTVVSEKELQQATLAELNDPTLPEQVSCEEVDARIGAAYLRADLIAVPGGCSFHTYFKHERRIVEIVERRSRLPLRPILSGPALDDFLEEMRLELGVSGFAPEQEEAIRLLASGVRTLVVCGYAGTGKSTLAKVLLRLLQIRHAQEQMVCMALSGVATDRIRTRTGCQAGTIHATLGYSSSGFEYNEKKRLPHEVLLLDESSMVNSILFRQLLDAVDDESVLILLGDRAQLDPIGPGDVYANLIENAVLPMVELTRIYRQGTNSVLASFAGDVRLGRVPEDYLKDGYRDFQFIDRSIKDYFRLCNQLTPEEMDLLRQKNNEAILEVIKTKARIIAPFIADPVLDFQVLSPMRKTILGTENLNRVLQEILNPGKLGGELPGGNGALFKAGDKVVHTRNKDMAVLRESAHPGLALADFQSRCGFERVYNGMVGTIAAVDEDAKQLYVRYTPDILVRYEALQLGEILEHAYCLSVHKSQGSEYRFVLLPISSSHNQMLNAKWMYTALTRARQKVVLVGQSHSFEKACRTLVTIRRRTVLNILLAARLAAAA